MTLSRLFRRQALLAAALLLCDAAAPEAWAGVGTFFSGMGARSRIVQLCVVVAGFSLLIILKKFSPDSRAFAPKMNYALSQTEGDEASGRQAGTGPAAASPGGEP